MSWIRVTFGCFKRYWTREVCAHKKSAVQVSMLPDRSEIIWGIRGNVTPPPPKITRVRRKEGTKVHYKVVYELYVENTYHGVSSVNCVCKGRQNLECWNQRRHVDTSRYLQCVCVSCMLRFVFVYMHCICLFSCRWMIHVTEKSSIVISFEDCFQTDCSYNKSFTVSLTHRNDSVSLCEISTRKPVILGGDGLPSWYLDQDNA